MRFDSFREMVNTIGRSAHDYDGELTDALSECPGSVDEYGESRFDVQRIVAYDPYTGYNIPMLRIVIEDDGIFDSWYGKAIHCAKALWRIRKKQQRMEYDWYVIKNLLGEGCEEPEYWEFA